MSNDMSMFKKMKERITDEVSSATNKLQSMQLTTNLGQQISNNNGGRPATTVDQMPTLPLPGPIEDQSRYTSVSNNNSTLEDRQFGSVDDSVTSDTHCDDGLDTKISPQHQLFDESSIRRLKKSNNEHSRPGDRIDDSKSVINLDELHSDLDDDVEIDLLSESCDEIASSSDTASRNNSSIASYKARYRILVHAIRKLDRERKSERNLNVNQTNDLNNQLESLKKELNNSKQYHSSNRDLLALSASSSQSENIDKNVLVDGRSSPQQASGSSSNTENSRKIKDLQKLLAKCKDSLRAKNSQLQILKDSTGRVDQIREMMEEAKSELQDLKRTYDTWTVQIAENKRVMHQEIEDKISEMDKYKSEIKDIQLQMKEQINKNNHLKSNIQNLESRLVSLSAAHQKERESLIKEMNAAKNSALKQQQREHELQIERIKLDLEKSIETLKLEILNKDEQIIKSAERQQELHETNQSHIKDLNNVRTELKDSRKSCSELKSNNEYQAQEISKLKIDLGKALALAQSSEELEQELSKLRCELEDYKKKCNELEGKSSQWESKSHEYEQKFVQSEKNNSGLVREMDELRDSNCELTQEKISQLNKQVYDLEHQLKEAEQEKNELKQDLDAAKITEVQDTVTKICQDCEELKKDSQKSADNYEQTLHELNSRLGLMTTANTDQEKALCELKYNYDCAMASLHTVKSDLDESVKKNESLLQVIQDNESEMQQQQDQIDRLASVKQELDNSKRDNSALVAKLQQVESELNERSIDLAKSKEENGKVKERIAELEDQIKTQIKSCESMRNERDAFSAELSERSKKRQDIDRQLIVNILSAIKNLETPDTSPVSGKTLAKQTDNDKSSDENGEWSQDEQTESPKKINGPDPLCLAKELSTLAMNLSNAYMTNTQRLRAVLLDNTMISDELRRLRDEINSLNQEKSHEIKCSLDEAERLKTENQALIHDQKAYDDQISSLESEIESLTKQLAGVYQQLEAHRTLDRSHGTRDISTETLDDDEHAELKARYDEIDELLKSREEEIRNMKSIISRNEAESKRQELAHQPTGHSEQEMVIDPNIPDSTEFEYLKNIVYQFMMGREPLTLVRVISAVFKFDKNQVDQICKIQEAIHQISG